MKFGLFRYSVLGFLCFNLCSCALYESQSWMDFQVDYEEGKIQTLSFQRAPNDLSLGLEEGLASQDEVTFSEE